MQNDKDVDSQIGAGQDSEGSQDSPQAASSLRVHARLHELAAELSPDSQHTTLLKAEEAGFAELNTDDAWADLVAAHASLFPVFDLAGIGHRSVDFLDESAIHLSTHRKRVERWTNEVIADATRSLARDDADGSPEREAIETIIAHIAETQVASGELVVKSSDPIVRGLLDSDWVANYGAGAMDAAYSSVIKQGQRVPLTEEQVKPWIMYAIAKAANDGVDVKLTIDPSSGAPVLFVQLVKEYDDGEGATALFESDWMVGGTDAVLDSSVVRGDGSSDPDNDRTRAGVGEADVHEGGSDRDTVQVESFSARLGQTVVEGFKKGLAIGLEKANSCHAAGSGRFCSSSIGSGASSGAMSDEQVEAFGKYRNYSYSGVNGTLRGDISNEKSIATAATLKTAIDQHGHEHGDIVVHRGVDGSKYEGAKVGDVISDKAFMSTSLDAGEAAKFANKSTPGNADPVMLQIAVPAQAKGVYMPGSQESEFVLQAGSSLRVDRVSTVTLGTLNTDISRTARERVATVLHVSVVLPISKAEGSISKANSCHASNSGKFCSAKGVSPDQIDWSKVAAPKDKLAESSLPKKFTDSQHAQEVLSRELGVPVYVDETANLVTVREAGESLIELKQQFPEVMSQSVAEIRFQEFNGLSGDQFSNSAGSIASVIGTRTGDVTLEKVTIGFNTQGMFGGTPKKAEAIVNRSTAAGHMIGTKSGGVKQIVTHEFGHAVDHHMFMQKKHDVRAVDVDLPGSYKSVGSPFTGASIYGGSNRAEGWAESFTGAMLGHSPKYAPKKDTWKVPEHNARSIASINAAKDVLADQFGFVAKSEVFKEFTSDSLSHDDTTDVYPFISDYADYEDDPPVIEAAYIDRKGRYTLVVKYNKCHAGASGKFTSCSTAGAQTVETDSEGKGKWRGSEAIDSERAAAQQTVQGLRDKADAETDPTKKAKLLERADKWDKHQEALGQKSERAKEREAKAGKPKATDDNAPKAEKLSPKEALDGKSIEEWKAASFEDRRKAFDDGALPEGFQVTGKPRPLTDVEQAAFPGEMVHAYYMTEGPHALMWLAGYGKFEPSYKPGGLTHNQTAKVLGHKNDEAFITATNAVKVAVYPQPGGTKILSLWSKDPLSAGVKDRIAGRIYDNPDFKIAFESKIDIQSLSGGGFTGKVYEVLKSEQKKKATAHAFTGGHDAPGHKANPLVPKGLAKADATSFADTLARVMHGEVSITKYNRAHDSRGRFTSAAGAGSVLPSESGKGKWRSSGEIDEEIGRANEKIYGFVNKFTEAQKAGDAVAAKKAADAAGRWMKHRDKQEELRDKALLREKKTSGKVLTEESMSKLPPSRLQFESGADQAAYLKSKWKKPVFIDSNTDPELVREASHQLDRLMQQYPGAATSLKSITFSDKIGSGTYAETSLGGTRISFNSNMSQKRYNTLYGRDAAAGFHPSPGKMTGVEAIATHEFGHVIDLHLAGKGVAKPVGKVTTADAGKVSTYAKHNGMESFAESFGALTAGTAGNLGIAPQITQSMLLNAAANGLI